MRQESRVESSPSMVASLLCDDESDKSCVVFDVNNNTLSSNNAIDD